MTEKQLTMKQLKSELDELNERVNNMGNEAQNALPEDYRTTDNQRLEKIERLIARMAHQTGTQNILKYFGVKEYEPSREDMQKWKG